MTFDLYLHDSYMKNRNQNKKKTFLKIIYTIERDKSNLILRNLLW